MGILRGTTGGRPRARGSAGGTAGNGSGSGWRQNRRGAKRLQQRPGGTASPGGLEAAPKSGEMGERGAKSRGATELQVGAAEQSASRPPNPRRPPRAAPNAAPTLSVRTARWDPASAPINVINSRSAPRLRSSGCCRVRCGCGRCRSWGLCTLWGRAAAQTPCVAAPTRLRAAAAAQLRPLIRSRG